MRKEKIKVVFLVCFISIMLGFWVTFLTPEKSPALAGAYDSGLIAYWNFDLNANDSAGVLHGAPSVGASHGLESGIINGAYTFRVDEADVIDIIDPSSFPTIGLGQYSFSAWIKTVGSPTETYQTIFSIDSANPAFYLSGGGTVLSVYDGGNEDSNTGLSLNDNAWHHVVISRTSTASQGTAFYMDGAAVGTDTHNDSLVHPTAIRIGRSQTESENFIGVIDEVGFWDRALSAAEVSELYNSGSGSAYAPNSLPDVSENIYPVQTSATAVFVTTTVLDPDFSDTISLSLEYSLDNSTWFTASTTANATSTSYGGITTSTGSIDGISMSSPDPEVSFEWVVGTDLPNTDDSTVYFRITANDGTGDGVPTVSSAFAVDTADPTRPGDLVQNINTDTTVKLTLPTTTSTDTNFTEYKIYYDINSSVDEANLALTSSTDSNLGDSNFNALTSSTISGLTANTTYYFNLWAYDSWGFSTSSASEISTTTFASVPNTPAVTSTLNSTIDITLGADNGATTYLVHDSPADKYLIADGTWSSSSSSAWLTYAALGGGSATTTTGLPPNSDHVIEVKAKNSAGVETAYSSSVSIYTLAIVPEAPFVVTSTSATTLDITLGADNGATTYLVHDSVEDKYLIADGTWNSSSSSAWLTYVALGNGSATSTTGLSANTNHTIEVMGRNGDGTETEYGVFVSSHTLANAAGTPTIGTPTAATLPITIVVNSNPAATLYAVYNSTDGNYLDTVGASTSTAVYSTTSTLLSSFAATGLTANTSYTFTVVAKNGDAILAATSTASTATYTGASVPSSVTATVDSTTQITLTYSGDATEYYAENTTASTNSDWDSGTTFISTGLTCATSYSFRVKGKNGDDVDTAYASSVSATTSDCPVTSSGGAPISVSPPSLPSVSVPSIASTIKTVKISTGGSIPVSVGTASHTVTVHSASSNSARVTIESDPITVTLKRNEYKDLDTNTDTIDDLRVTYIGLIAGEPQFSFANLTDENELKKPVTINYGAYDSNSRTVILSFNVSDAEQMAVSNYSDFRDTSFVPFTNQLTWTLPSEIGESSIFVRFRSKQGGTAEASDTIYLASFAGKTPEVSKIGEGLSSDTCVLAEEFAYKHDNSNSVYYITPNCTKRAFIRSDIFFTYFDSWDGVKATTEIKLDSISNDSLGFMPYGPKYDPKYGALVKMVTDPKVYLLLGTEKYWITSEAVFETLNYAWNWIEDVAVGLLDKYTVGSEITDVTKHPNHTLIKYADSPKVYKLEEGKKRYIPDEATFNSLKYRWDRIVTVDVGEVYENGLDLGDSSDAEDVVDNSYVFESFLTLGSSGEEVKQLQLKLKELGFFPAETEINSYFGPITEQAVKDLQTSNNLESFGYVGPGTRVILNG